MKKKMLLFLKKLCLIKVEKNELFNDNIELMARSFNLPIHANLIDVEISKRWILYSKCYCFDAGLFN